MSDCDEPNGTGPEAGKRIRKLTEKGKDYHLQIVIRGRKKAYNRWRKQLNRSEAILLDSEDLSSLRRERNELEACFNALTAEQEQLEDELDEEEEKEDVSIEYDQWEKENQLTYKTLNGKIADLLSDDGRSTSSSRRSQSYAPSIRSSIRSCAPTESKIMKAARLNTELKFCELENEKARELKKKQDEMKILKKRKELAITKAEIAAEIQEEKFIPPSDNDNKDLLNKYLDEQLSEATGLSKSPKDENETERKGIKQGIDKPISQPPSTAPNGNETERKEVKKETNESISSEDEFRNEMGEDMTLPLSPKEKINEEEMQGNENKENVTSLSDNENETKTENEHEHESKASLPLPNDPEDQKETKTKEELEKPTSSTLPFSRLNKEEDQQEVKQTDIKRTNYDQPSHTQTSTPIIANTDALSRLADLLSRRQERNDLPRPEPDVFNGDLLRFPLWIKAFETLIESRTTSPAERLYYLGRYTIGDAKEAIEGLLSLNSDQAYSKAKTLLQDRFGNAFLIANAFRRKINDWPKIANSDGPALRKFADFLEHCRAAMKELKYLNVLDDPEENQKMLKKLPSYLLSRWSRIVDQWLTTEDDHSDGPVRSGYPPFKEFCKFIQSESRIACNPITSLRHLKEDNEKAKTPINTLFRRKTPVVSSFATGIKNGNDQQTKDTKHTSCPLCEGGKAHDLDECKKFNEMTLEKRKEFARSKGLCWGCLGYGHKSRYCKRKKTCKVCEGSHPSSLHDFNYRAENKVYKPREETAEKVVSHRIELHHDSTEDITSHSLIVPVIISHKHDPKRELLVYALLDEQSDACFVKDSTLKKIGVDGPRVYIQLSTVLGKQTIKSKRITGLIVKGARESKEIRLPKSYARDIIPAKRSQIPRPETALKWPHLRRIANDLMPYRDDVEIGILIGLNCAAAIKPREVIPGNDNDPYAKRTALGWGIIGVVNNKAHDIDYDQDDSVIHKQVQTTKEEKRCHFAVIQQTKEILNPHQVFKMFELDFSERERDEKSLSFEDKRFLKTMSEKVHQLKDGHYEMSLPFKRDRVLLENNIDVAMKRLMQLKKRLQNDPQYREDYVTFMSNIITNGHAEEIPKGKTKPASGSVWYIPHHGVYHPQKPGKIRVVFDCSATHKGQSLNQQLMQGPDLTNSLVGVLCRFRLEPVAFMCDIEKMFFQVKVNAECRDYLRFLWWEDGDVNSEPKEFRMTVHLFGAVSSPGCANFALKKTADDFRDELGSEASHFIKQDFYVDDGLKSVPTTQDAIRLIDDTKNLCKKGGFRLHKFVSNSKEVIDSIPKGERAEGKRNLDADKDNLSIERALGVQWCVESDTFQFRITLKDRPFTRRGILATVSSVFDPLGMVSPVILQGKRILQTLCQHGVEWDERVPDDLRPKWERWRSELISLTELKINRCHKPPHFEPIKAAELHHFCDASTGGYGQCSYLRLIDVKDRVHCSLVMAKSRVTPLKPITIPRLELSAALVSVKVSTLLRSELSSLLPSELFWTDSQVVLGYICNDARRFHTFVANRVQQIRDRTTPEQWQYVDTKSNPADHASRGLSAKELLECETWWNGPKFLWSLDATAWEPPQIPLPEQDDPEVKKQTCFATKVEEFSSILKRLEYFSDWHRAKRAIAICLRLKERLKTKNRMQGTDETKPTTRSDSKSAADTANHKKHGPVEVKDLQDAERIIIKELQKEHFEEEMKVLSSMSIQMEDVDRATATERNRALKKESSLHRLDPFLDQDGLLRVGGRLNLADIPYHERHPLIIPKESHVTSLILCHFHGRIYHQGRGMTQNEIRSAGFWIVGGKAVILQHVSRCIKCRKLRSPTQGQKMADLPKDRLQPTPPFTYSGVDCFGPFLIKQGRKELKRYGAIFTCMASRAIHIEVLHTMETDSFINAYRRFIGRRGPIRQLRSDQGTNFVGAKNELQRALSELDHKKIGDALLEENCDWVVFKMNVPHASHMGGVWERQIRSVRNVLNVLLDRQGTQLDDESLSTLMVEAETIVNSRPLSTETSNPTETMGPISPNQLLTMKSKVVLPPPGDFQRPDLYSRKRWRRVQYLANEFWMKWRRTFLQALQQRPKWTKTKRNLEIGDIVLVKDETLPRNKWMLARITETMPCHDERVRKVTIAVADASADCKGKRSRPLTLLQRPVHKLVMLYSKTEQRRDQGIPLEEP